MKVFSLNKGYVDDAYIRTVWNCIKQNEQYFKKFNGTAYEEAMHLVLVRAINNQKEEYSDITPYIKKLARTELRQRQHDSPYSLTDEESGEIARPFLKLTETFDVTSNEQLDRLRNVLTDMYLTHPDDIMALRPLIMDEKMTPQEAKQAAASIDSHVKYMIGAELKKIRGRQAYQVIADFYNDLAMENSKQLTLSGIKTIAFAPADYRCKTRIPTEPTIRIVSGKQAGTILGVDSKVKIKMTEEVNLDVVQWAPISKSKCDIIKIDICPIINYLYENIYTDVNTDVKRSYAGRYVLTTFGGQEHLNIDEETFIDLCIEEIILNFIANNINNVIGFTTDSIYIRPVRKVTYDTLRCKSSKGKIIDLSVSYYKTK